MALYGSTSIQVPGTKSLPEEAAELLNAPEAEPAHPTPAAASEVGSKTYLLVFVLVLLNSVLLGAIASIGWGMYRDMQTVAQPFLALTSGGGNGGSNGALGGVRGATAKSGTASGARALVQERLEDTLSAATTFFLFGDADSAIAAFVSNLLRFDFASFGAAAQQFGAKLASTFHGVSCQQARVFCNTTSPGPYWSSPTLQCPPRPGFPYGSQKYGCQQFPNLSWTGPPPPAYWMNCGLGCPFAALETVGGAISAVANAVKQVVLPASAQQVNVGPASFSTGVFRLDGLLQWVQSQFNLGAWASAGSTCSAFFSQLQSYDWANCFTDTTNCAGQAVRTSSGSYSSCVQMSCWNITSNAIEFFNRTAQVCDLMAALNS